MLLLFDRERVKDNQGWREKERERGSERGRVGERERRVGQMDGGAMKRAYPTSFGRKSVSEPLTGAGHVFAVKSEPYKIHVKK